MKSLSNSFGLILLPLSIASCTVGDDYVPPKIEHSGEWNEHKKHQLLANPNVSQNFNKLYWPSLSEDKILTQLIWQTLEANNELKIAEARIVEARANERLNQSSLFPQVNTDVSVTRGEIGSFGGERIDQSTRYGLNGQWNLDLFGRTRRLLEAAEYNTQAQKASLKQLRLILTGEVIRNYLLLRQYQEQYKLTEQNITSQRKSFKAIHAMREEGMATELEVLRANAQIENTLALLPQFESQISAAIYRLATLTANQEKENIHQELKQYKPIPEILSENITSQPINTLSNRPDVKEAERQLASATALSAAAFARFFPDISLNAFVGKSNSDVFGSLSPWTATASAILSLLDFGSIQAEVDIAEAREQQAFYNFKQTVLEAVEEVEVSYANYFNETERLENLRRATSQQQKALNVAQEQFYGGIISQLDLLDTQRNVLQAEIEETTSHVQSLINLANLYIALGGDVDSSKDVAPVTNIPSIIGTSETSPITMNQLLSELIENIVTDN